MRNEYASILLAFLFVACDAAIESELEPVDVASETMDAATPVDAVAPEGAMDRGLAPDSAMPEDGAVDAGTCDLERSGLRQGWFSTTVSETAELHGPGVVITRTPTLAEIDVDAPAGGPVRVSVSADATHTPALELGDQVQVALWSETSGTRSDLAVAVREPTGGRLVLAAYVGPSDQLRAGILEDARFLGIPTALISVCSAPYHGPCISEGTETRLALRFGEGDPADEAGSGETIDFALDGAPHRAYVQLARSVTGTPNGCSHFPMGDWVEFFILPR